MMLLKQQQHLVLVVVCAVIVGNGARAHGVPFFGNFALPPLTAFHAPIAPLLYPAPQLRFLQPLQAQASEPVALVVSHPLTAQQHQQRHLQQQQQEQEQEKQQHTQSASFGSSLSSSSSSSAPHHPYDPLGALFPSFVGQAPPTPLARNNHHQQNINHVSLRGFGPVLPPTSPLNRPFEYETEFVPLDQQARTDARTAGQEKPFDIDVVTSDVGGSAIGGNTDLQSSGVFFQQSFPFFGNEFFNSFGGFGLGPAQEPWWKGPNVCTDKEEEEKTIDTTKDDSTVVASENTEIAPGVAENVDVRPPLFGQFHFSLNSCVEKPNKYICTRVLNQNGKKKTITVTRQCCHGYGRARNADYVMPCEKLVIKPMEETAADMGASEFIASAKKVNTLAVGEMQRRNVSLFMPNDRAYGAYNDQMQSENNLVERKSDEAMRDLYRRHVGAYALSLYDARNEQVIATLDRSQTIRINAYQMPRALAVEPFRFTVNCVPVDKHDKPTESGLMHTLDGVLRPVSASVMDLIRQRPDLSIMRTILETTKLSEMLEGAADKPMTMFLPNDAAFDKLEPHLRRTLKEGKACASNILKNHMLDLTFCSVAAVANAKTTAFNLLGEPLRFNRTAIAAATAPATEATITEDAAKSESADASPAAPKENSGPTVVVINGEARILVSDLMATNGVLHVIDTVLTTPTAQPLSTLMAAKNVTLFSRLLSAAGMDEHFDDMANITMFAPTDKALQSTEWARLLDESPDQLRNNAELKQFIEYHVIAPLTKTCDLTEQSMPTIAGPSVRINLYSTHSLFSNVMNRATVNCARLVHFDDESCGSVLHQIDKPLVAPKQSLLQMLEANPQYSRFLDMVRAANVSQLLANTEEAYTLLVPKNEVFEEVADWQDTLAKEPSELENLIKTHIVNDVVCCAGIIPTNWPFVRSIEALNGAHLRITRDRRPKVENAGVTKCDSIASNGILHEINDVIVPPSPRRRQQQGQEQQLQPHPFDHHAEHFGDLFV